MAQCSAGMVLAVFSWHGCMLLAVFSWDNGQCSAGMVCLMRQCHQLAWAWYA